MARTTFYFGSTTGDGHGFGTGPSVDSLWAWFKPESLAGYANAAAITTWSDSSGNSRDLTPGSGTPQCATNELAGYSACVCNTSENMSKQETPTTTTMTVFAVWKTGDMGAVDASFPIGCTDGLAANRGFGIAIAGMPDTVNIRIAEGTPINAVDGNLSFGTYYILVARHGAGLTEFWLNGTNTALTNSTTNYVACNSNDWLFTGSAGQHPDCHSVELGVYNKALNDTEIDALHTYLNGKFSIY